MEKLVLILLIGHLEMLGVMADASDGRIPDPLSFWLETEYRVLNT